MEDKEIQELLKPRVKVIADFWDNPFDVGQIILFDKIDDYHDFYTAKVLGQDWTTPFMQMKRSAQGISEGSEVIWSMRAFTPYPHLFQPLQWWQDRKPEEMPEYVKHNVTGLIVKVENQSKITPSDFFTSNGWWDGYSCRPATETEYNNQKGE